MAKSGHKYIFVIGGVMSGVGKGIASSSMGVLLQAKGFHVNLVKVDPYLNVDAGTMNPTEHGEVFVLDSGLETDQDMGNYERFLNRDLGAEDYMTGGMIYQAVIARERALGYGGKCVEAIPDVRNEIQQRYENAAEVNGSDISVIEIGGTIGDFQNALFIDAARVMKMRNPDDITFVMVSYLPVPSSLGEMKTRPTQNAVRQLNAYGVHPDFLIARSKYPVDEKRKKKIAIACSMQPEHVVSAPDIESIYDVPLNFEKDKLAEALTETLRLPSTGKTDLVAWKKFVRSVKRTNVPEVDIAIVGKYFDTGDFVLSDAYLSVIEAIKFSAATLRVKPRIHWINAKDLERSGAGRVLAKYDGILVPGGFGESGIDGKLRAIEYARTKKIPYFGLCYGMQLMVIEYARNVVKLSGAHTVEIDSKTVHPVVVIMENQKEHLAYKNYGGSMRLGAYSAHISKGTIARSAYKVDRTEERHRHRYEINPTYVPRLEEAGLVFSARSPDGVLMEIAELPKSVHPFMLSTQFHPEFTARPLSPHPLFTSFLKAVLVRKDEREAA